MSLAQQALQHDLNLAARLFFCKQAGRNHPGVIEHQQITRLQQFGQARNESVAQRPVAKPQLQQPAVAAPG